MLCAVSGYGIYTSGQIFLSLKGTAEGMSFLQFLYEIKDCGLDYTAVKFVCAAKLNNCVVYG